MGIAERTERQEASAGAVWLTACDTLKGELGADIFGSWVGKASLRQGADGDLVLVTPTGIARDWIRRNAWRRIQELWSQNDPQGRPLSLKSRVEFDSAGGQSTLATTGADYLEMADPVSSDMAHVEPARAGRPATASAGLQERLTFSTFVSGPTNEFACAVAKRVASWSDGHFNPVVFHGPYGFGKTHLLNAIAHEATRVSPERKVVYLTAERFLSTFIRAIQDKRTGAFKDTLRDADLLLIDDVHFIAGKQSTQQELFHTLTALMEDGRRVVFTSNRAPVDLDEMDARLRSHLQAGLVCGIEPADKSLREGILTKKLDALGRSMGQAGLAARPEVMAFLADRFTDSVREMEGALNTLVARLGAGVADVGLDDVQAILRPNLRGGERRVTVDQIQKAAAEYYGLTQADLISERRNRAIARPRQAAMWVAKQITTRSLPDIGRRFGGRDHTTVLHAIRRIEELKQTDAALARDLEALIRKLRG
jgi:chromosomal replication initiator protein